MLVRTLSVVSTKRMRDDVQFLQDRWAMSDHPSLSVEDLRCRLSSRRKLKSRQLLQATITRSRRTSKGGTLCRGMSRFVALSADRRRKRRDCINPQYAVCCKHQSSVFLSAGTRTTLPSPLCANSDDGVRIHAFRRDLMQNSLDITISIGHDGQKPEDNAEKKRLNWQRRT